MSKQWVSIYTHTHTHTHTTCNMLHSILDRWYDLFYHSTTAPLCYYYSYYCCCCCSVAWRNLRSAASSARRRISAGSIGTTEGDVGACGDAVATAVAGATELGDEIGEALGGCRSSFAANVVLVLVVVVVLAVACDCFCRNNLQCPDQPSCMSDLTTCKPPRVATFRVQCAYLRALCNIAFRRSASLLSRSAAVEANVVSMGNSSISLAAAEDVDDVVVVAAAAAAAAVARGEFEASSRICGGVVVTLLLLVAEAVVGDARAKRGFGCMTVAVGVCGRGGGGGGVCIASYYTSQ
jgi:hypothetical protein